MTTTKLDPYFIAMMFDGEVIKDVTEPDQIQPRRLPEEGELSLGEAREILWRMRAREGLPITDE